MKDTFAKIIEAAEALDWRCNEDSRLKERYIEFEQDTPAGEDFIFTAYGNTPEALAKSVFEYAEEFDITEHVQQNLGGRGAPGAVELVEDAKEIKKMLDTLAEALLAVSRGEEYKPQPEPEQNPKLTELLELMEAHPDLPVLPMVDSEIVADDYCARWLGSWGTAKIVRYWAGEERYYFYDEEDIEDVINDPACIYEEDELTEERALEVYRALPWVECIAVNIDLPDE